jgi:hypothetical protein
MVKGRSMNKSKPTSLFDHVIYAENKRHASRLVHIRVMSAKLRQFEPFWAALEARGIRIDIQQLRTNHQSHLAITCGLTEWDHALFDALIELGFKEADLRVSGPYSHLVLKKGRLAVALMIRVDCARPKPASPPVQTSAPQTPEA